MLIQAKINVKYPCPYSSTVILSVFGTLQCALLSLIKTRHLEDWILRDELTIITVIIAVYIIYKKNFRRHINNLDPHNNQILIYGLYMFVGSGCTRNVYGGHIVVYQTTRTCRFLIV